MIPAAQDAACELCIGTVCIRSTQQPVTAKKANKGRDAGTERGLGPTRVAAEGAEALSVVGPDGTMADAL